MLATALSAFLFFALKVAPIMASYVITLTYLPQIWKTTKTKNVDGISFQFWVLLNVFLLCMFSNSLGLLITTGASALGYFVTEAINWGFAIWQLILLVIYGKEERAKNKAKRKAEGKKWWNVSL